MPPATFSLDSRPAFNRITLATVRVDLRSIPICPTALRILAGIPGRASALGGKDRPLASDFPSHRLTPATGASPLSLYYGGPWEEESHHFLTRNFYEIMGLFLGDILALCATISTMSEGYY